MTNIGDFPHRSFVEERVMIARKCLHCQHPFNYSFKGVATESEVYVIESAHCANRSDYAPILGPSI